jgi:CxxC motif-containing protein (DUF1111 family)
MDNHKTVKLVVLVGTGLLIFFVVFHWLFSYSPDTGKLGGPIDGLTPEQLRKFYATRELFVHKFEPDEGLGPFYNGQSCYQCHGAPGTAGGQGNDIDTTSFVRFGALQANDIEKAAIRDRDITHLKDVGGPQIYRYSTTSEFRSKYPNNLKADTWAIPQKANLISRLTAPPLFGLGLLNSISDSSIEHVEELQIELNPYMRGRVEDQIDALTKKLKCGRFGWKNQQPNLLLMTAEMMHRGLGITSFVDPQTIFESSRTPDGLRHLLPPEPNDAGSVMTKLTYFLMLLAPPPPAQSNEKSRRGEVIFDKLQCSICHIPELTTSSKVLVVDPDSQFPKFRQMEITALENKPVRAYTDLLLHNMGKELADGLPEKHTTGGEWRTAPLWGLRMRKYFLHDGRASNVSEAIEFHGGQAEVARKSFLALPPSEKEDLLSFLHSL